MTFLRTTQTARYVVSTMSRENGIGGLYTLNYQYAGAKVDVRGRGLGFRTVTVTDAQTGIAPKPAG